MLHNKNKPITNNNWFEDGWPNIWLPYTQMQIAQEQLKIKSANGVYFYTEDNRKIIDGTSSWWTACHGYSHPYIVEKMQEQLHKMSHVMFAGIAHEQAYILAQRLANLLPNGLEKIFFTDSGSTAVETASKIAIQYWHNKNIKGKNKFICFYDGYHGDTMHCMSLSDPRRGYHKNNRDILTEQFYAEIPDNEDKLNNLIQLLEDNNHQIAGLFIEPLVQAAGGLKFHNHEILLKIYNLCKKYNILFIADEVMTGFLRTGTMFAINQANIVADIICLGKSLTAGMLTLAVVATTQEVFNAFLSDSLDNALMCGPTFMANPLACSAANASLDLFEAESRVIQVNNIAKIMEKELNEIRNLKSVIDIRIKGAIAVIELDIDFAGILYLREKILNTNIWIRPFANVVYLMPPYIISEEDLKILCKSTLELIHDWHKKYNNK